MINIFRFSHIFLAYFEITAKYEKQENIGHIVRDVR